MQAVRKGHWIVLDELNLAPTEVLEALNRQGGRACEFGKSSFVVGAKTGGGNATKENLPGRQVTQAAVNVRIARPLAFPRRLLDDNRELYVPELQEVVRPHPHFMLFATQNPPGIYAGRKTLSRWAGGAGEGSGRGCRLGMGEIIAQTGPGAGQPCLC